MTSFGFAYLFVDPRVFTKYTLSEHILLTIYLDEVLSTMTISNGKCGRNLYLNSLCGNEEIEVFLGIDFGYEPYMMVLFPMQLCVTLGEN